MSVISNNDYLKAVCHEKPNCGIANFYGYKEENGSAKFTRHTKGGEPNLALLESEPTIANEFLGDFFNKITTQYVVNLFEQKPLNEHFGRFLRTYGKVGDIEEYIATKLQAVVNYDSDTTPTNPFEVKKPQVVLSFIKTEDKELTSITLNYEQWYGAFITEGGLNSLASLLIATLNDSLDLDIYYKICKDLGDKTKIKKTKEITKITGAGEQENAKKCYEEIMKLRHDMNLPSKTGAYNSASIENTGTPYKRMVLYLNSKYTASFDINVLASLFKSEKIDLQWDTIEFVGAEADVIGVLMDERAYAYGPRIKFTQSIMNPRNMFVNTYAHMWTKRGFIPFYNAVLLKERAGA